MSLNAPAVLLDACNRVLLSDEPRGSSVVMTGDADSLSAVRTGIISIPGLSPAARIGSFAVRPSHQSFIH
jgi:hypothetical protein